MRDRDLRASLLARGAINPAYEYAGTLIDGRRRRELCGELGKPLEVRVCETLQEACSTLFPLHDARALELARSAGATSLLELAELCGTTPTTIAKLIAAPKKSHKRAAKEVTARASVRPRMLRRLVIFEPELYECAKAAANKIGHRNVSRLVRDSLWRAIKELQLDGAPVHQPRRVQPANGARRRAG